MSRGSTPLKAQYASLCVPVLIAVGLTWGFWWPLWQGGGLIGGDLYPYYFPQKTFLADSLKSSVIPLWNPLVGFGYPTLGESQTGVLYPPNLVLYSLFDVNTAYNISQLGHYFIAFLAAWSLARRLNLSPFSSLFSATAFVYGWFPARICLEWAIIGGAWFVAILWAETVYLQTRNRSALVLMSLFLGLDLLAGHYNLAFITILTALLWPFLMGVPVSDHQQGKSKAFVVIGGALATGFLIAAVQLVPTWELKTVSQRQQVNNAFSPTYGHLPPLAISQLWAPWSWFAGDKSADELLHDADLFAVQDATNQVEAFLYCGLLTLPLAALALLLPTSGTGPIQQFRWRWLLLCFLGLLFATGWPTQLLSAVPGFGFFRGPGRYSIVAALAITILAGSGLNSVSEWLGANKGSTRLIQSLLILILVADLWMASRSYQFSAGPFWPRQVFYASLVDDPPVNHRDESVLKEFFSTQGDQVRLYAPGQNVPTMLGVSSLPVYLGLGPAIYETDQVRVDFSLSEQDAIEEDRARLIQFGVTHLLLEEPIDETLWQVEFISRPMDALLNRAFARREPYYLYALKDSSGRAYFTDQQNSEIRMESSPHQVSVTIPPGVSGELVLADLDYPGWVCDTHQGTSFESFRAVQIETGDPQKSQTIRWTYRPWSVYCGAILSVLGILGSFLFPILVQKKN